MTITIAFKSKWGFHPVNYETFLLLKRLHKWYHAALKRRAAWWRWANKLEYNRKREEPNWHLEDRAILDKLIKYDIVSQYHRARLPRIESEVQSLDIGDSTIRELAEKI